MTFNLIDGPDYLTGYIQMFFLVVFILFMINCILILYWQLDLKPKNSRFRVSDKMRYVTGILFWINTASLLGALYFGIKYFQYCQYCSFHSIMKDIWTVDLRVCWFPIINVILSGIVQKTYRKIHDRQEPVERMFDFDRGR